MHKMTTGDLIKQLADFCPDTPVELLFDGVAHDIGSTLYEDFEAHLMPETFYLVAGKQVL